MLVYQRVKYVSPMVVNCVFVWYNITIYINITHDSYYIIVSV